MPSAERRICLLGGRAFAIVLPPGKPERESDRLCGVYNQLPPPPDGSD
jgi:hypothetical protein